MASPVDASTLLPLLPTTDKSLCERIQPGIINFMAEVSKGYSWEFKVNGEFSDEFVEMVRALECVGGGVVVPCPVVALAGTATPGNTTLALSFNGTRMVAGYDYDIYQSITEGVFVDPAIDTGVTVGSIITFDVTGLTNGVTYYFKLVVQKPTCDEYEVEISGVPQLCRDLLLTLSVVSGEPSAAIVTVTGNLLGTEEYTLYASNLPNQIGTVVSTGVVSDHQVTINGAIAFQEELVVPPVGIPGGGAMWYYTFQINDAVDPSCPTYELTQNVFVNDDVLDAPVLSFSDLAFRWGLVPGASYYSVYGRPIGNCRSSDEFVWIADVADQIIPFLQSVFPCTHNLNAAECSSLWEVKVAAKGPNGTSAYSNVANTPEFIRFAGQCTG